MPKQIAPTSTCAGLDGHTPRGPWSAPDSLALRASEKLRTESLLSADRHTLEEGRAVPTGSLPRATCRRQTQRPRRRPHSSLSGVGVLGQALATQRRQSAGPHHSRLRRRSASTGQVFKVLHTLGPDKPLSERNTRLGLGSHHRLSLYGEPACPGRCVQTVTRRATPVLPEPVPKLFAPTPPAHPARWRAAPAWASAPPGPRLRELPGQAHQEALARVQSQAPGSTKTLSPAVAEPHWAPVLPCGQALRTPCPTSHHDMSSKGIIKSLTP